MFQDLRFLSIEGDTVITLEFEEAGTTPKLKKIFWCNMTTNQPGIVSGVHHLRCLEEVVLKGHFVNLSAIQAITRIKLRYP
jgi:hypothetical protein